MRAGANAGFFIRKPEGFQIPRGHLTRTEDCVPWSAYSSGDSKGTGGRQHQETAFPDYTAVRGTISYRYMPERSKRQDSGDSEFAGASSGRKLRLPEPSGR